MSKKIVCLNVDVHTDIVTFSDGEKTWTRDLMAMKEDNGDVYLDAAEYDAMHLRCVEQRTIELNRRNMRALAEPVEAQLGARKVAFVRGMMFGCRWLPMNTDKPSALLP